MLSKSFYSTLGLASRARKIITGEILVKKIQSQQVSFVIIASDASDNTKKKLSDKCKSYNIDYIIDGDINSLSLAVGKNNRVAIGIEDPGFAKSLKQKIGG